MAKQTKYGLLNRETGEVLDYDVSFHRHSKVRGRWLKVFQDSIMEFLRRNPHIKGQSLRMLLCLISRADWANLVPSTAKIAIDQHIYQSNVSRAYTELTKAGFLIKKEHSYYISPLFCWKGDDQQYQVACRELLKVSPLRLETEVPKAEV